MAVIAAKNKGFGVKKRGVGSKKENQKKKRVLNSRFFAYGLGDVCIFLLGF